LSNRITSILLLPETQPGDQYQSGKKKGRLVTQNKDHGESHAATKTPEIRQDITAKSKTMQLQGNLLIGTKNPYRRKYSSNESDKIDALF